MKTKILLLNVEQYYKKALIDLKTKYDFEFYEMENPSKEEFEKVKEYMKKNNFKYCYSPIELNQLYLLLINENHIVEQTTPLALLYGCNKYLSRSIAKDDLWFDYLDPKTESDEEMLKKVKEYPFILKMTNSCADNGVFKIKSKDQLLEILNFKKKFENLNALEKECEYQNKLF